MVWTSALLARALAATSALALVLATAACSTSPDSPTATSTTSGTGAAVAGSLFDSSAVHEIAIEVDTSEYDAAIATYLDSGEKEWVSATVTVDGQTFTEVGIRLKGNSSLRGLTLETAQSPEDLPWLVRLDKYVDGQALDGVTSFVIRSNTTQTALNEAVALELIGLAGLATEASTPVRLSVNGSDQTLRLVVENPDDAWMADELGADGVLYKAEATGDYTYRGDDPEAYDEVFDVEAGAEDYGPLTEFLRFLDEADDETFAAELPDRLDVDAFATYLAVQELVDNFDDIDGPGNNSYLYYDEATGRMTVVAWDQNLSFGVRNVDQQAAPGGAAAPGGDAAPGDTAPGGRPAPPGQAGDDTLPDRPDAGGGRAMGGNVLSERFLADETFAALYAERLAELTAELYDSGAAAEVLAGWTAVLTAQASDLVPAETVETEASSIAAYLG